MTSAEESAAASIAIVQGDASTDARAASENAGTRTGHSNCVFNMSCHQSRRNGNCPTISGNGNRNRQQAARSINDALLTHDQDRLNRKHHAGEQREIAELAQAN